MSTRFIQSSNWRHSLCYSRAWTVRWIADRVDNSLVHAQLFNHATGHAAGLFTATDRDAILDDIKAKGGFGPMAIAHLGLREIDRLPDWVPLCIRARYCPEDAQAWGKQLRRWGYEIGRAATMHRNPTPGTITHLFEENGLMMATLEFTSAQPDEASPGQTSTRFTLPARLVHPVLPRPADLPSQEIPGSYLDLERPPMAG